MAHPRPTGRMTIAPVYELRFPSYLETKARGFIMSQGKQILDEWSEPGFNYVFRVKGHLDLKDPRLQSPVEVVLISEE